MPDFSLSLSLSLCLWLSTATNFYRTTSKSVQSTTTNTIDYSLVYSSMNQRMFMLNGKSVAVSRLAPPERQGQRLVKPGISRRGQFHCFDARRIPCGIASSGALGLSRELSDSTGIRPILRYGRNARCSASGQGQTQTIQAPTQVIEKVPVKDKSPYLDDGGSGFPPREDGSGGGGGGGGSDGSYSGGFFLFGFLALLGLVKDMESELHEA